MSFKTLEIVSKEKLQFRLNGKSQITEERSDQVQVRKQLKRSIENSETQEKICKPTKISNSSLKFWELNSSLKKESKLLLRNIVENVETHKRGDKSYFPKHPYLKTKNCIFKDMYGLKNNKWLSGCLLSTFTSLILTQIENKENYMVFDNEFYGLLSGQMLNDNSQRNKVYYEKVKIYTEQFNENYLKRKILLDIHLTDHWIKAIMDPTVEPHQLTIIDSFKQNHPTVVKLLIKWRKAEVRRFFNHKEVWIVITSKNNDKLKLVQQTDTTSCGVITAMQGYYFLMYNRLPTIDDFTQEDVPKLRKFMLYEMVRISKLLITKDVTVVLQKHISKKKINK